MRRTGIFQLMNSDCFNVDGPSCEATIVTLPENFQERSVAELNPLKINLSSGGLFYSRLQAHFGNSPVISEQEKRKFSVVID